MEGTNAKTRLLGEGPSLLGRTWEETSGSAQTSTGRHFRVILGLCFIPLCSVLGIVLLGCRSVKFEAMWSLWQVEKSEYNIRAEWQDETKSEYNIRTGWKDVNMSTLERAWEKGAVCIDGSPPAYFLNRGSGDGANNWLVFHEGGNWCPTPEECYDRAFTELGSSTKMVLGERTGGILNSSPVDNPDFYNWNKVFVKYCDGACFTGDVSIPVEVGLNATRLIDSAAPVAKIFLRGQRIWEALMRELMEKGMKNAEMAILAGCSAGGLTAILHCDQFHDLMPETTRVKCFSDGGFFIDIPDITGAHTLEDTFAEVVQLHNSAEDLPKYCTSEMEATRCFFPEHIISGLRTPLFMLNAAYDTVQMDEVLVPPSADPNGIWDDCREYLSSCSRDQLKVLDGLRSSLLEKLQPLLEREKHGAVIDSCCVHCQAHHDTWNGPRPKFDNKTLAQVFADWYFDRNSTQIVDGPYPSNPTCLTEHIWPADPELEQ
ncbi:unnamed protein product [Calypogeia fissa]